jgi:hypothetical protein
MHARLEAVARPERARANPPRVGDWLNFKRNRYRLIVDYLTAHDLPPIVEPMVHEAVFASYRPWLFRLWPKRREETSPDDSREAPEKTLRGARPVTKSKPSLGARTVRRKRPRYCWRSSPARSSQRNWSPGTARR